MWRGRPCLRAWPEPRAESRNRDDRDDRNQNRRGFLQGPGLHVARLPFGQPPNGCWESQLSLKMRDFFEFDTDTNDIILI